jgi:hypothetical protein
MLQYTIAFFSSERERQISVNRSGLHFRFGYLVSRIVAYLPDTPDDKLAILLHPGFYSSLVS